MPEYQTTVFSLEQKIKALEEQNAAFCAMIQNLSNNITKLLDHANNKQTHRNTNTKNINNLLPLKDTKHHSKETKYSNYKKNVTTINYSQQNNECNSKITHISTSQNNTMQFQKPKLNTPIQKDTNR